MNIISCNLNSELIVKIKQIDDKYYKSNVSIDWYNRYNENNKVTILLDKDEIVGYVIIAGIEKNLYKAIKNKLIVGDISINPNKFNYKSNYKYLSSIVILNHYQKKGYGTKLIEKALEKEKGRIIAITISNDGFNLLKKHFIHLSKINETTNIFEKKL